MNKVEFKVLFNNKVDSKNEYNQFESFFEKFFTSKITDNLLYCVEMPENYANNILHETKKISSKKQATFDSYNFEEFKEVASLATDEIRNSFLCVLTKSQANIESYDVSFSMNFMKEKSTYCPTFEDYIKDHIIGYLKDQTEMLQSMTGSITSPAAKRVAALDNQLLELLNQMENTLVITNENKPSLKIK